jgi:hypothetical protein
MWHHVEVVLTDILEECIASIFRLLLTSLTDASRADFLIFPSTLEMEAIRSSETSVNTTSTRCHIPEDCFLQVFIIFIK